MPALPDMRSILDGAADNCRQTECRFVSISSHQKDAILDLLTCVWVAAFRQSLFDRRVGFRTLLRADGKVPRERERVWVLRIQQLPTL